MQVGAKRGMIEVAIRPVAEFEGYGSSGDFVLIVIVTCSQIAGERSVRRTLEACEVRNSHPGGGILMLGVLAVKEFIRTALRAAGRNFLFTLGE